MSNYDPTKMTYGQFIVSKRQPKARKPMNKHVELFNKVNELLEYDKDPIGVTAWWSEPNAWFGWHGSTHTSPLLILTRFVPRIMSEDKFIKCVKDELDDDARGMD